MEGERVVGKIPILGLGANITPPFFCPRIIPGFRDWLRADFANASASAHCSLRSTNHKVRLGKVQCAPTQGFCAIPETNRENNLQ
jgi:hypothetical protein